MHGLLWPSLVQQTRRFLIEADWLWRGKGEKGNCSLFEDNWIPKSKSEWFGWSYPSSIEDTCQFRGEANKKITKRNILTQIRGFLVAVHECKPLVSFHRCPHASMPPLRGPAVDLQGMFTAFTGVFLDVPLSHCSVSKKQFSTWKQQGRADNYLSADSWITICSLRALGATDASSLSPPPVSRHPLFPEWKWGGLRSNPVRFAKPVLWRQSHTHATKHSGRRLRDT